jgi:hypothetical protein
VIDIIDLKFLTFLVGASSAPGRVRISINYVFPQKSIGILTLNYPMFFIFIFKQVELYIFGRMKLDAKFRRKPKNV